MSSNNRGVNWWHHYWLLRICPSWVCWISKVVSQVAKVFDTVLILKTQWWETYSLLLIVYVYLHLVHRSSCSHYPWSIERKHHMIYNLPKGMRVPLFFSHIVLLQFWHTEKIAKITLWVSMIFATWWIRIQVIHIIL